MCEGCTSWGGLLKNTSPDLHTNLAVIASRTMQSIVIETQHENVDWSDVLVCMSGTVLYMLCVQSLKGTTYLVMDLTEIAYCQNRRRLPSMALMVGFGHYTPK